MILSPLRNADKYDSDYNNFGDKWIKDGVDMYAKWGLKAHNGQDIATPWGTNLYAPMDGTIIIGEEKRGFGLYITIYGTAINAEGDKRRIRLAHLSSTKVKYGQQVKAGDLIGRTGNSGGVASHLHWDYAIVNSECEVKNYGNGFHGCIDIFKKGWITKNEPTNL